MTRSEDDARAIKELAERLLTHPHPEGPTAFELLVGRLPDSWGAIPEIAGARLLGSAVYTRRGRPTHIEAVYDADGDSQGVLATCDEELMKHGWTVFEGFGGMHGGFVPAGLTGAGKTYRRGDEGPILMVAAMDRESKPTDLRLRLDWEMIRHLPDMRRHGRPEGAEKMPPLSPPAGAALHGGGGGGGSGSWHSEASVETSLPIADIASHFARQLERAGWTRLAGNADDVVAWSSWQVPGEGDWRGLLLVLGAFKAGEPYLYLRIEAGESHEGGWYSSGTMAFRS
ncbi:MAG TPA: hypothetical protein VF383_13995 [Candidatus Dormibacteraeota bacterium]